MNKHHSLKHISLEHINIRLVYSYKKKTEARHLCNIIRIFALASFWETMLLWDYNISFFLTFLIPEGKKVRQKKTNKPRIITLIHHPATRKHQQSGSLTPLPPHQVTRQPQSTSSAPPPPTLQHASSPNILHHATTPHTVKEVSEPHPDGYIQPFLPVHEVQWVRLSQPTPLQGVVVMTP